MPVGGETPYWQNKKERALTAPLGWGYTDIMEWKTLYKTMILIASVSSFLTGLFSGTPHPELKFVMGFILMVWYFYEDEKI